MADEAYDVIVIGGGPGGYPAAIRASQLGLRVALVERAELGGICLNWGCIPTKALLRSAEILHLLGRLDEFGLRADNVGFDLEKLVKRSRRVAKRLNTGVRHLLRKSGVEVVSGHARLTGEGRLQIETPEGEASELQARHVILATGARPRALPGIEPDGESVWTYKEAMIPERVPASLLVIGSGAIGMEFASFYADLGVEITVVEMLPRILPVEDEEISAFACKQFERRGMKLIVDATVAELERGPEGVKALVRRGDGESESVRAERAILAVGIVGNVEDLGLEQTAVEIDRTHIVTDEFCRTAEPGVYAIGDVAGPPWLAHKATHEGVLAVEHLAGVGGLHPLDSLRIPGCTYCRPQIASVGLGEAAARERGFEVRVGRFPLAGNGKAVALGETQGLVKTVFDAQSGELLGAHLVGADVTELVHGFVLAMNLETTEAELMRTVFAHPTLSESMHESVLAAYDRAIHV